MNNNGNRNWNDHQNNHRNNNGFNRNFQHQKPYHEMQRTSQPQGPTKPYFINPYNFIPLSENPVKRAPYNKKGEYTGFIDCELTLQTPLIVVDTDSKRNISNSADDPSIFDSVFTIDGKMAIPGSELRGMIRSKYETLTNSCLSKTDDELPLFGRGKGGITHAGLLDLKENILYEADSICVYRTKGERDRNTGKTVIRMLVDKGVRYQGKVYHDYRGLKTGYQVEACDDMNGAWRKGVLKIGNPLGKQEAVHVFIKKQNGRSYQDKELSEFYKNLVETSAGHKSICKADLCPVWYGFKNSSSRLGDESEVYISLGQNGKIKFKRTIEDVMNIYDESYKHCIDKNALCEACEVFGTVTTDKKKGNVVVAEGISVGGKVRFEDAIGPKYQDDEKYYALSELASPKVNPYFYFCTGDEEYPEYNIDFKYKFLRENKKYLQRENDAIAINGRKEYWHHKINGAERLNAQQVKDIEAYFKVRQGKGDGEQEKYVRKVITKVIDNKANPVFRFKVYYNNLTKEELNHLVGALALQDDNKKLSHKLGMAKPYGFGSVQVKVNYIAKRKLKDYSYQMEKEMFDPGKYAITRVFDTLTDDQLSSIRNMYDFNYIKEDIVSYPYVIDRGARSPIFKWFMDHAGENLPFPNTTHDEFKMKQNTMSKQTMRSNKRK